MKIEVDFTGIPILYKVLNKQKRLNIEVNGGTLRDVMNALARRYGTPLKKALLDEKGDIDMEIRVILNSGPYLEENRMDVPLSDGDLVAFRGAS
jgi:hypothetical protein